MTLLRYRGSIKTLRETLCRAQWALNFVRTGSNPNVSAWPEYDSDHLQSLIGEIDRHRPLGPNGKHGNLHTQTCGCDDAWPQLPVGRSQSDQLDELALWLVRNPAWQYRLTPQLGASSWQASFVLMHEPSGGRFDINGTGLSPYTATAELLRLARSPGLGTEPDPGTHAVSGGLRDEQAITVDDGQHVIEIPTIEVLDEDRGMP
jgi:hypothetical protein